MYRKRLIIRWAKYFFDAKLLKFTVITVFTTLPKCKATRLKAKDARLA